MNPFQSYAKLHDLCLNLKPIGKIGKLTEMDYDFYFAISDILTNKVVMSSNTILHHSKTSCRCIASGSVRPDQWEENQPLAIIPP